MSVLRLSAACAMAIVAAIAVSRADSTTSGSSDAAQSAARDSPSGLEYRDASGRFSFNYPASFGRTSDGTNNGFGDRVAAIRFSTFSALGIGGEAVLTRGRPLIDIQAVGGLYDPFGREALTTALLDRVDATLPALTVSNFCDLLGRAEHLDPNVRGFQDLPAPQRDALRRLDRMGNVAPRILECDVQDGIVTFRKEAAVVDGGPRRHVFGTVRFLQPPYSTFQIVQARTHVDSDTRDQVRRAVASWRARNIR